MRKISTLITQVFLLILNLGLNITNLTAQSVVKFGDGGSYNPPNSFVCCYSEGDEVGKQRVLDNGYSNVPRGPLSSDKHGPVLYNGVYYISETFFQNYPLLDVSSKFFWTNNVSTNLVVEMSTNQESSKCKGTTHVTIDNSNLGGVIVNNIGYNSNGSNYYFMYDINFGNNGGGTSFNINLTRETRRQNFWGQCYVDGSDSHDYSYCKLIDNNTPVGSSTVSQRVIEIDNLIDHPQITINYNKGTYCGKIKYFQYKLQKKGVSGAFEDIEYFDWSEWEDITTSQTIQMPQTDLFPGVYRFLTKVKEVNYKDPVGRPLEGKEHFAENSGTVFMIQYACRTALNGLVENVSFFPSENSAIDITDNDGVSLLKSFNINPYKDDDTTPNGTYQIYFDSNIPNLSKFYSAQFEDSQYGFQIRDVTGLVYDNVSKNYIPSPKFGKSTKFGSIAPNNDGNLNCYYAAGCTYVGYGGNGYDPSNTGVYFYTNKGNGQMQCPEPSANIMICYPVQGYPNGNGQIVYNGNANAVSGYKYKLENVRFPDRFATNLFLRNVNNSGCTGTQMVNCCPIASTHVRVTVGTPDIVKSPDPLPGFPDGNCDKCKCVIDLPSALYANKEDGSANQDLVLDAKEALLYGEPLSVIVAQFKSKRAIIVREGLVLKEGAILMVDDPRVPQTAVNNYRDQDLNNDDLTYSRNFIENITYDDDRNIVGHTRSYFDSKGEIIQTQSKLLSGAHPYGMVMATQTVYDEFGRPVVNTLPAPVRSGSIQLVGGVDDNIDATCASYQMSDGDKPTIVNAIDPAKLQRGEMAPFGFDDSFIKDASGNDFDNTDINPGVQLTGLSGTTSKLGWYYSTMNDGNGTNYASLGSAASSEPFAPSSAFPFSQTIYNNDGSGEILTSIAPGHVYRSDSPNTDLQNNYIDNVGFSLTLPMPTDGSSPNEGSYYYNNDNSKARILTVYLKLLRLYLPGIVPSTLTEDVYTQKLTRKKFVDEQGRVSFVISNEKSQPIIVEKFIYNDANAYTHSEYAFNFYDLKGQLRRSVSPNGVIAFYNSECTTSACAGTTQSIASAIDHSETEYDFEGRMTSSKDNDRGITYYKYRKDGLLRFSQNAEQAVNGSNDTPDRFSYTNYDRFGRPIESGEYTFAATGDFTFATITDDLLENKDVSGSLVNPTVTNGKTTGGLPLSNLSSRTITYYEGAEANSVDYVYPTTGVPARDNSFLKGKVSASVKVGVATSWYVYDDRGRVKALVQNIIGLGTKVVTYKYNPAGQVSEVNYQEGANDAFFHAYAYDYDGRLTNVKVGNTKSNLKEIATYTYYKHGPLKTNRINSRETSSGKNQDVDYIYTIEGWLKAINNPNPKGRDISSTSSTDDQFAMRMEYYNGDYLKSSNYKDVIASGSNSYAFPRQQHNGTPWAITYSNKALQDDKSKAYANIYKYDSKNQLVSVKFGTLSFSPSNIPDLRAISAPTKYDESFTYDANGNITSIKRYNYQNTLFQDYTPTYASNTNQMLAAGSYVSTYTYNAIGQTQSANRGEDLYNYSYNPYGLLEKVTKGGASQADYSYDAAGQRVGIQHYGATEASDKDFFVRDASGNILAVYNKASVDATPTLHETPMYGLSRIGTSYYRTENALLKLSSRIYEISDHLGNVRATLSTIYPPITLPDPNSNTPPAIPSQDIKGQNYYAYGSEIRPDPSDESNAITSDPYRYGYQGQYSEKDPQTGFNHFELRDYDAVTGRWTVTDPKRQYYSPYLGMGNNPINRTDPNGGTDGVGFFGAIPTQAWGMDGWRQPANETEAQEWAITMMTEMGKAYGEVMLFAACDGLAEVALFKLLKYLNFVKLPLKASVSEVMGVGYRAVAEVKAEIKNLNVLKLLNENSKGEWVKVYEAAVVDEAKVELHYFRNESTKEVFDVKVKETRWAQKEFKKIK